MATPHGSRAGTYGMLAELFIRPPDRAEVDAILGHGSQLDPEELAADFTDLLRGPRRTSPPPPYESLHREGVMMGKTTEEVIEIYRAFGLVRSATLEGEPADHISLELDFMRHLCDLEATTRDPVEHKTLLAAQLRFLSDHLSQWVGSVRDGFEGADRTGFYTQVAEFTRRWVNADLEQVKRHLEAEGGAP